MHYGCCITIHTQVRTKYEIHYIRIEETGNMTRILPKRFSDTYCSIARSRNQIKFRSGNKYGGPLEFLIVGCEPVYSVKVSAAMRILRRQRNCNTACAMNRSISDLSPRVVCNSTSMVAYAPPSLECRKCLWAAVYFFSFQYTWAIF